MLPMEVVSPMFRHLALSCLLLSASCFACSVKSIPTPTELVGDADVIVRAVATEYQVPPADPNTRTTGVANSVVKFTIVEVVRGRASSVSLHGYLVQTDDYNDQKPPYRFVRPGGRAGSCFANSYKQGAEYLLFLKRARGSPELTVNWAALAPVNEQLHGDSDPWLSWVRDEAKRIQK
jgi:hypothetical protein